MFNIYIYIYIYIYRYNIYRLIYICKCMCIYMYINPIYRDPINISLIQSSKMIVNSDDNSLDNSEDSQSR